MLEATLYGLPMTGYNAPRRTALDPTTSGVGASPVATGTPGASVGLAHGFRAPWNTPNIPRHKDTVVQPATDEVTPGRDQAADLAGGRGWRLHPARRPGPAQADQGRHGGRRGTSGAWASAVATTPTPRTGLPADGCARHRGLDPQQAPSRPTRSSRSGWPRPTTSARWARAGGHPSSSTRRSTARTPSRIRTRCPPTPCVTTATWTWSCSTPARERVRASPAVGQAAPPGITGRHGARTTPRAQ